MSLRFYITICSQKHIKHWNLIQNKSLKTNQKLYSIKWKNKSLINWSPEEIVIIFKLLNRKLLLKSKKYLIVLWNTFQI